MPAVLLGMDYGLTVPKTSFANSEGTEVLCGLVVVGERVTISTPKILTNGSS